MVDGIYGRTISLIEAPALFRFWWDIFKRNEANRAHVTYLDIWMHSLDGALERLLGSDAQKRVLGVRFSWFTGQATSGRNKYVELEIDRFYVFLSRALVLSEKIFFF